MCVCVCVCVRERERKRENVIWTGNCTTRVRVKYVYVITNCKLYKSLSSFGSYHKRIFISVDLVL